MKKHKKLWIILIIILIVAGLAIWATSCAKKASGILESMGNSAKTATIESRDIINSVSATGSVTSLSSHSLTSTLAGSKVITLNVQLGDSVKKGDVICILDDSDLQDKLEDTKASQENSKKLTNIEISSAKRGLSDSQQTSQIQSERADESVDSAYNKYEKNQNKANDAYNKYTEAVNDTKAAKDKKEAAKEAYDNYRKNPPKTSEDMEKYTEKFENAKTALYDYLDGLKATVEGISTRGIKKLEITTPLTISPSDYYTGTDADIIAQITAYIADIAKYQGKYATAAGELAEKIAKKTAKLKLEYETASKELEVYETTESTLKDVFEKLQEAVDPYLENYKQAINSRDDINRNNDQIIAAKKDALNSTIISSNNSSRTTENAIETIEEQISDCTIVSDYTGIITSLNVQQGVAYAGGPLVTIEDTSALEVTAFIDEYDISKVSVGQAVKIKTNGTGALELAGTVKTVSPRAAAAAGSVQYQVIVSIDTPCDDLRLDMTAKLEIVIEGRENVLSVPYEAIMVDEKGEFYVEVLDSGSPVDYSVILSSGGMMSTEDAKKLRDADASYTSHRVKVKKGLEGDYFVEVISDELKEGTVVVIPNNIFTDIQSYMGDTGATGGF